MEGLQWVWRDRLVCPRFFCGICGKEIMEAAEGAIDFLFLLDYDWAEGDICGETIRVAHKTCVRPIGVGEGWSELGTALKQLVNNYHLGRLK